MTEEQPPAPPPESQPEPEARTEFAPPSPPETQWTPPVAPTPDPFGEKPSATDPFGRPVGAAVPMPEPYGGPNPAAPQFVPAAGSGQYNGYPGLQIGSRGGRFVSQLIDGLVVVVPVAIIAGIIGNFGIVFAAIYTVTWALYAPLMLAREGQSNGQTIGKATLGLRVVRTDQPQPVTFSIGLKRELLGRQLLSFVTFGVYGLLDSLWCLWDPQKQTLHDKIGATLVVRA